MKRRLYVSFLLFGSACAEAHPPTTCDPAARAGQACSGEWTCPATSIEESTGTHFMETRCDGATVHERTWSEPPVPPEPPLTSCDPAAPMGAACEGAWECPEETTEGSTGTQHEQIRCEDGRVVRDFWIEPLVELDAGVPVEDAGAITPLGCRVALDEVVATSTDGCTRLGLYAAGEHVRIAWSGGSSSTGVLAIRSVGSWTVDTTSFGTNVRRIDLTEQSALVERHGGTVELWYTGDLPIFRRSTLEGVHVGAQSRALVGQGRMIHAFTTHTHVRPDGFYEWSLHHSSGNIFEVLAIDELLVGSTLRAYDVDVDSSGTASFLYQNGGIGGPVLLARDGDEPETLPRPPGVEPHPYDDVAPALATYADGSAYALVRRTLPAGPLGQRYEQLIAVRSPLGSWELLSLATDEEDPCASVTVGEGASCTVDRTTYGPEAAVVAGPLGPLVLIATHHVTGARTYSCTGGVPGCVPCSWRGELAQTSGLAVVSDLRGGLAALEGVGLAESLGLMATAVGTDVHLAISEHDAGECTVRYVRLACGE